MDAIRQRQVAEVVDENKTIGNMVFALEKRWVQSETDNVLPYSQINAEVLDSTTSTINSLFVLLEKKRAETFNMAQNNHPQRYQRKQSVDEISMIEDVLRLYNTVAEPFMDVKNALTQQTKSEMLQRIRKIQPSISYIVNGLARILGNYYRDRNTPARRDEIRGFYVKILEAYVCYSLILEQLTSGGIHPSSGIE